jgi:hypothetical protein
MLDATAMGIFTVGGTTSAVGDSSGSMVEGWSAADEISVARSAMPDKRQWQRRPFRGANGQIFGGNCDRSQGAGGKGDDGNDDNRLRNRVRFYFEGEFHMPGASGEGENGKMDSKKSVGKGAHMRGRKPGTITMTEVRAMESPWFLVRAKTWW